MASKQGDEPAAKRARSRNSNNTAQVKVKLRAEAPNGELELYVDESVLTPPYFKADLRWQDGNPEPTITFELPEGCREEGLKLMVQRMVEGEGVAWSITDWWWKIDDCDVGALLAVLFLMDLVLLEHYCKEVVQVFAHFKISLPENYHRLGKKYSGEALLCDPPVGLEGPSIEADAETLETVLKSAVWDKHSDTRCLAERFIAGAADEVLASALVWAAACLLHVDKKRRWGYLSFARNPWLYQHLRVAIMRRHQVALQFLEAVWWNLGYHSYSYIARNDLPILAEWLVLPFKCLFIGFGGLQSRQMKELVADFNKMLEVLERILGKYPKLAPHMDFCTVSAAHLDLQMAILQNPGLCSVQRLLLRGKAHLIRPEGRVALMASLHLLTAPDKRFLKAAAFPHK